MTVYPFSALLSRMRYIARWGLMRAARQENLAEHTAETAQLAHLLALLARDRFSAPVSPERVAVAALYHDASEILTGDLPTPVKYNNEELKTAYKALEREAEERLAALAPPEVRDGLRGALCGDGLTEREKRILKAADKLSALIKCVEERQGGNLEFESAAQAQREYLAAMDLPEADYFMERMLPAYTRTLDELTARESLPDITRR